MTVYICVPKDRVQDLDDRFVIRLGDGDEAIRSIMAAKANPRKVAVVGDFQTVMVEWSE